MKTLYPAISQKSDLISSRERTTPQSGHRRFSRACLERIQQFNESILSEMSFRFAGTLSPEMIRLAVNEADALASSTPFPALFLPALAEEKLRLAQQWHSTQQ